LEQPFLLKTTFMNTKKVALRRPLLLSCFEMIIQPYRQ
jgi:hypothetical protein